MKLLKSLWNWILRILGFMKTINIPFHYEAKKQRGMSRALIVRAGSSMRRGRLIGV